MDRVIATISHLTGKLTFYCPEHTPSIHQLDDAYKAKYIIGCVKESELSYVGEHERNTAKCLVCGGKAI